LIFLAIALSACSSSQQVVPDLAEPVAAGSGSLIVEIEGLRNVEGAINLSLFRTSEGFPDDTASVFRSGTLALADNPNPVFRFEGLGYGNYAVTILHDENDNGSMDTGFLGVPTEGFGFSNNPRIGFGPPSFESCRFRFDSTEFRLRITIRYF
jgi:uncharacterized protein (DUF2141 family)